MNQPIIVAVTSDQHCGSTVGLCPPEKIGLDDGGFYEPSDVQKWVWDRWSYFWEYVAHLKRDLDAQLYVVFNGDLFEGDHHGTAQIISRSSEPQVYVAGRAFGGDLSGRGSPVTDAEPDHIFIVRGTETHVGPSGVTEEAFARTIMAERNPDTEKWSWWRLRMTLNNCLLDFQHHPGTHGKLPWTAPQGATRLAFLIWSEHCLGGMAAPNLAFRSHVHRTRDSYDAYPTRAIITPAWQIKTSHAHKVAPESLSDVGGIIAIIWPSGEYEIEKKVWPVPLPELWTPPQATTGETIITIDEEGRVHQPE